MQLQVTLSMKTFKASKKTTRWGFTLIELLATLTIMAVIAAILFPFVTNYTKKANHDTALRSLRILQDAMDRFRSTQDSVNWQLGGGPTGTGNQASYSLLSQANASNILTALTQAGSSNQTLRLPSDTIQANVNAYICSTTTNLDTTGWEVLSYRRNTNVNGVDRKGNDITNWATDAASQAAIDKAFQQ
jgi:prepilin-type N-terminal cleavage/methylation domain-containing protein